MMGNRLDAVQTGTVLVWLQKMTKHKRANSVIQESVKILQVNKLNYMDEQVLAATFTYLQCRMDPVIITNIADASYILIR